MQLNLYVDERCVSGACLVLDSCMYACSRTPGFSVPAQSLFLEVQLSCGKAF